MAPATRSCCAEAPLESWDDDCAFTDDQLSTVFLTRTDLYENDEATGVTVALYGAPNTCTMCISGRFYFD